MINKIAKCFFYFIMILNIGELCDDRNLLFKSIIFFVFNSRSDKITKSKTCLTSI